MSNFDLLNDLYHIEELIGEIEAKDEILTISKEDFINSVSKNIYKEVIDLIDQSEYLKVPKKRTIVELNNPQLPQEPYKPQQVEEEIDNSFFGSIFNKSKNEKILEKKSEYEKQLKKYEDDLSQYKLNLEEYKNKLVENERIKKENEKNTHWNNSEYLDLCEEYKIKFNSFYNEVRSLDLAIQDQLESLEDKYLDIKNKTYKEKEELIDKLNSFNDVLESEYYDDIASIICIVKEGRANNIQDAINIMHQDEQAEKLLKEQQRQNDILEEDLRRKREEERRHNQKEEQEAQRFRGKMEAEAQRERTRREEEERYRRREEEMRRFDYERQLEKQRDAEYRAKLEDKARQSRLDSAKKRYDRAASFYESYSHQGLTQDALRQKKIMDQAMADIIVNK